MDESVMAEVNAAIAVSFGIGGTDAPTSTVGGAAPLSPAKDVPAHALSMKDMPAQTISMKDTPDRPPSGKEATL